MRPPGLLKPEDFENLTDDELHQVRRESDPGSHYRDWADLEVERRDRLKQQPAPRKWKFSDIPHPIQIGLMLLGIGVAVYFGLTKKEAPRPHAPAETAITSNTTPPPTKVDSGKTTETLSDKKPTVLEPVVRERVFSVLIPVNDGEGDPIPEYRPKVRDVGDVPPLISLYGDIHRYAKEIADQVNKPKSTEDIDRFLGETVRYFVFTTFGQLESDRTGISMDYRKGMKSIAISGIHPPNEIIYPAKSVVAALSSTMIGSVRSEIGYWQKTSDKFRVPAESKVKFTTTKDNGTNTYNVEISNPAVYAMTFRVNRTLLLDNRGFVPNGFDVTSETLPHIRTFTVAIKADFAFKRTMATDPVLQDEYIKWADGLFDGFAKLLQPSKDEVQKSVKQRALLLANKIQQFYLEQVERGRSIPVISPPRTKEDNDTNSKNEKDFHDSVVNQFREEFEADVQSIIEEIQRLGLDVTAIKMDNDARDYWKIPNVINDLRNLASQIDDNGNLIR
jgi:hypothetical protein